jgi:hypothetical protein
MTDDKLSYDLNNLYGQADEIGVSVYVILKGDEAASPKKVDIEEEASTELKHMFIQSLQDSITNKENISVLDLSTADERIDAIYKYDLDLPDELKSIREVLTADDFPLLDLNSVSLANIKALIVEIGNNAIQAVLYKTMAPINIFGRSNFFLKKSPTRMEQITEEFLRVSPGFQLLNIGEELFVLDLKAVEKSFGFHDVIKKEATKGISAIEDMELVDNPEVLNELLEDVRYARRLTKIAKASPVIEKTIPNDNIIEFCKTFPKLAGKIRFNDAEDRIILDTKVSKDLFIKLLMDDYLTSELTELHYESIAKDSAEPEPA